MNYKGGISIPKKYICKGCGKSFNGKPNRNPKYCSRVCSARKTLIQRKSFKCSYCGVSHTHIDNRSKGKYCSNSCGLKHWHKLNKNKKRPYAAGANNPGWKGGVTSIHESLRRGLDYRIWREAVFKRDKFTCKLCGQVGGELNSDHIKPFALFPLLRFEVSNGRTLCKSCHEKTDTYGGRTNSIRS